jgi:hypothetical protein
MGMMSEAEGSELVDERPNWLPSNFKSPEDLIASYHESTGRLSQLSERLQETEETLNAVLQAQEQEPVQAPPARANHLDILKMLAEGAAQSAVRNLKPIGDYDPGAQVHAAAVERLVAADRELVGVDVGRLVSKLGDHDLSTPEQTHAAIRGLAHQEQVGRLHDLGRLTTEVAAAESRLMKLKSQSASGAAGRPVIAPESDEDYGRSLIAAHNQSYASRMSRATG